MAAAGVVPPVEKETTMPISLPKPLPRKRRVRKQVDMTVTGANKRFIATIDTEE